MLCRVAIRLPDLRFRRPGKQSATGQNRALKSTQYHQQSQHHHRANAHGSHIPAQIAVLAHQQTFACEAGQNRRDIHQRVQRIALQQPGNAEEWFDEHFVV